MSGEQKNKPIVPSSTDVKPKSEAEKDEAREKALDKTLADSFPTSDPPSSIPNPAAEDAA